MAEENGRAETSEQEGTDTQRATEPDYKALYEQAKSHSRERERKAKALKAATTDAPWIEVKE